MSKASGNTVRIERWTVADTSGKFSDNRKVVSKIAVRDPLGRFHGATNFKGSFF